MSTGIRYCTLQQVLQNVPPLLEALWDYSPYDKVLALAEAQHPRLGVSSAARFICAEDLRLILRLLRSHACFRPKEYMQAYV